MRWNDLLFLRRSFFLGMLAVSLCAATGCGGGKGKISGKVTLDGQPLQAGRISFVPSKGTGATTEIKNGEYSVEQIPPGEVKVTVDTKWVQDRIHELNEALKSMGKGQRQPPAGKELPEGARKQMAEEQERIAKMQQEVKDLESGYKPIPEKYSKAESSGLSLNVKSGSQTFDVPLSSK